MEIVDIAISGVCKSLYYPSVGYSPLGENEGTYFRSCTPDKSSIITVVTVEPVALAML